MRRSLLGPETLFVMTDAAPKQAGADNTVAHDHHGGENSVARQSCFFGWSGNHYRNNKCRLNHCHGQGEDKRAKGFADAVCNYLRVVHGCKHSGEQDYTGRHGDEPTTAENRRHKQHGPGQYRPRPCPPGRPC